MGARTFAELFVSRAYHYGALGKDGHHRTIKDKIEARFYENHLNGVISLGVSPFVSPTEVLWGVLDVDNHATGEELNLGAMADMIEDFGLPLIPCRSRSGGIHIYIFLEKAIPARLMQFILKGLRSKLKVGECEVFPKQTEISEERAGNWINLPYHNTKETNRYGWADGSALSLREFVTVANDRMVNQDGVAALLADAIPGPPPCLQRMLKDEPPTQGERNNAIFHIGVYSRRAFEDSAPSMGAIITRSVLRNEQVTDLEIERTLRSALKGEYEYKCGESPCSSRCDRETCITRAFGVGAIDGGPSLEARFANPRQHMTEDPPLWTIEVDGHDVTVTSSDFVAQHKFRVMVAARIRKLLPLVSRKRWEKVVSSLMEGAQLIEAPEDASFQGLTKNRLIEYLGRAEDGDLDIILRGVPVKNNTHVYFTGTDFFAHLKRTRQNEIIGSELWVRLTRLGVTHKVIEVMPGMPMEVWCAPIELCPTDPPPVKFENEF